MEIFLLIFVPILMFALPCFISGRLSLRGQKIEVKDILDKDYRYLIKKAMKDMNGREFELFIGEMFIRLGHTVEVTPASRDKGIDLIVDGIGIECKHYNKSSISSPIVLKLMGALQLRKLSKGIIITTSNYTRDAIEICPKWIDRWYTEDIVNQCDNIKDRIGFIKYLGYNISSLEREGVVNTHVFSVSS